MNKSIKRTSSYAAGLVGMWMVQTLITLCFCLKLKAYCFIGILKVSDYLLLLVLHKYYKVKIKHSLRSIFVTSRKNAVRLLQLEY